jgi:hypothetical protein
MGLTVLEKPKSCHAARAFAGRSSMCWRNSSRDIVLATSATIAISIALSPAWAFTEWELNHPITGRVLMDWCGSAEDSFKYGMCVGFFWGMALPCGEAQPTPPADATKYVAWAARHANQLMLPAPVAARAALCERK